MNLTNIINNVIIFLAAFMIIYLVFGVILYFNQRSMIYFPSYQDFYKCEGFDNYEKIDYNGTRFYFKQRNENVIVYYHGNAGSACDRSQNKFIFEKTNNSLIFVEYAGFSNDNRKPSKELILNDVKNINNFIEEQRFKKIIIYGESLGSAVGSYHAKIGNIEHLILVTPFSSIKDIAKSQFPYFPVNLILKENYDNIKWLSNYEGKITILHGNKDSVVPAKFSKKLYENLKTENKQYILIEGFNHNDLWLSNEFNDKLFEVLK